VMEKGLLRLRPERVRTPISLLAWSETATVSLLVAGAVWTGGAPRVWFTAGAIIAAIGFPVGAAIILVRHRSKLTEDDIYWELHERVDPLFEDSPDAVQTLPLETGADTSLEESGEMEVGHAAEPEWSGLEEIRRGTYEKQRGMFLVHTWRPSQTPGQVADVVLRLWQHGPGPLTSGGVRAVTYDLGPHFDPHTATQTNGVANFRDEVSAWAPMLCLAKVDFNDGHEPITLTRYVDFEPASRSEAFVSRVQEARDLVLQIREQTIAPEIGREEWPGTGVPLPPLLEKLLATQLKLRNALLDLAKVDAIPDLSLTFSHDLANAGVTPAGVAVCNNLWSAAESELNRLLETP
jgi:hypothetical protein